MSWLLRDEEIFRRTLGALRSDEIPASESFLLMVSSSTILQNIVAEVFVEIYSDS